jgi:hypothetical protein
MIDQDPNETAQISGSDFAQMCDEMKQLRAERDALRDDVARLRNALEQCFLHIRHAKDCATKDTIWKPCDCGMPEVAKLATAALATLAK